MKFVKTFLVMLFSLTLIGSQTVFNLNAVVENSVGAKSSKGCGCSMTECCMQQSSESPSVPLASLPVNPKVQQQQFVAAVCTILLQEPGSTGKSTVAAGNSLSTAPAVPLFKQNCIFLI